MALGSLRDLLEQGAEQAFAYGVGGGLTPLVDVFGQPLRNELWSGAPTLPLDAAAAALAELRRGPGSFDGAHEAQLTGVNHERYRLLLDSLRSPPSTGELLELLRRGGASVEDVRLALERGGLALDWLDRYLLLRRVHLSATDLALARQQEFISDAELHAGAAIQGVTAEDADLLYKLAGLPPGVGEALELLRRGEIDEGRFAQIVAEGHTKTKYTGDLLKLRYQPLSASVAAELLIRERIGQADAVRIAEQNGVREADFLTWSHGLGRPIAHEQALTIINRGLKGNPDGAEAHAYFREAVARSDVRTEYADDLYELRVHYPPLFQVLRALGAGTISPELAQDTLRKEGYPEAWVAALTKAGQHVKTTKHRDLAASIVDTLYEAGLESHEAAAQALETLGYTPEEADHYLQLWLARRIVNELVHGISVIRQRYVSWKIDRPAVVHELNVLLQDAPTRDRLLSLWDGEREANAPVLSSAEIGRAFHYGRYSLDEALQAWQQRGHTPQDAFTLAWIVAKGDPRPQPPAG